VPAQSVSATFHPSTHPCHLVSTLLHVPGAHILEAHMPGRTCRGRVRTQTVPTEAGAWFDWLIAGTAVGGRRGLSATAAYIIDVSCEQIYRMWYVICDVER
jgi:hypothetical protein